MQTHSRHIHPATPTDLSSVGATWGARIGRAAGTLGSVFLLVDSAGKLLGVPEVIDGARQLGYSPDVMFGIGVTLLSCVVVYLIPRTAVLGAVLLTGYLGGAVATHVRVGNPLFSHVLFPVYIAVLLWGGLAARDPRMRALLPFRTVNQS